MHAHATTSHAAEPVKLCASDAKSTYKLNESDLAELACEFRRNPHYRSAPDMRLYTDVDLRGAVQRKLERLREEAALRAAAEVRRASAAKEEKARTKSLVKTFRDASVSASASTSAGARDSDSIDLPPDILKKIASILASSLEVDGVRGPGIVARDVLNFGMACLDTSKVVGDAIASIGEASCEWEASRTGAITDWDRIVADPTSFKLPELKEAARGLGVKVSGTKPELVMRVLGEFGIDRPRPGANAKCLSAVHEERTTRVRFSGATGSPSRKGFATLSSVEASDLSGLPLVKLAATSVREFRDALVRRGIATEADLKPAIEERQRLLLEKRRADEIVRQRVEAERATERRRRIDQRAASVGHAIHSCVCGQASAKDCTNSVCGTCCYDSGLLQCKRHGNLKRQSYTRRF